MPCTAGQQRYYNLSLCQNKQETNNSSSYKSEIKVVTMAETYCVEFPVTLKIMHFTN
jgi:hypothetical protein